MNYLLFISPIHITEIVFKLKTEMICFPYYLCHF